MSDEDGDLDALVRRVDPDRWLASRYISDAHARADVIALYALNYELSRAAEVASQPLIGEIRLAWWREAVEEICEGRPVRRHPVALALAEAVRRRGLPRPGLEALIDGRLRELEPWPLAEDEVLDYLDATAGCLMTLGARALAGAAPGDLRFAGRAWGLAGLLRIGGRLPPGWEEGAQAAVERTIRQANAALADLPVAAFPAVAYATLARAYAAGGRPSELSKRARLTWAVVTPPPAAATRPTRPPGPPAPSGSWPSSWRGRARRLKSAGWRGRAPRTESQLRFPGRQLAPATTRSTPGFRRGRRVVPLPRYAGAVAGPGLRRDERLTQSLPRTTAQVRRARLESSEGLPPAA